jgi:arsenate reductase
LYLDTPPDAILLQNLLNKLNMSARDLLRRGEDAYKNLLLNDISLTDEDLILAMAQNPSLIERPIVVCGEKAALLYLVARPFIAPLARLSDNSRLSLLPPPFF